MNVYWTERFLEDREIKRNEKITNALTGKLKPADEYIINKLKERNVYEEHCWQVQVLRD